MRCRASMSLFQYDQDIQILNLLAKLLLFHSSSSISNALARIPLLSTTELEEVDHEVTFTPIKSALPSTLMPLSPAILSQVTLFALEIVSFTLSSTLICALQILTIAKILQLI